VPYRLLVASPAQRDFRKLPPEHRDRVHSATEALADDPSGKAEKLAGAGTYRVRVGDHRVVFRIDDVAREVLVTRVRHRRDVYR